MIMNNAVKLIRALVPWCVRRFLLDARASLKKIKNRSFLQCDEVKSIWVEYWANYYRSYSIKEKCALLKKGLDETSCSYVDVTHSLYQKLIRNGNQPMLMKMSEAWNQRDMFDYAEYKKIKNMRQLAFCGFRRTFLFDPYFFYSQYGLRDVLGNLEVDMSQKAVFDVGAYHGDTAILFLRLFKPKRIYSYEPNREAYDQLRKFIKANDLHERIHPRLKGLSNKKDWLYSDGMMLADKGARDKSRCVEITTIDEEVDLLGVDVGLIKLDVEGFESLVVEGAMETIRKYKPILCICIYHRPSDFFELKPKLEAMNLGYKFLIRRSELASPLTDLVLIAY